MNKIKITSLILFAQFQLVAQRTPEQMGLIPYQIELSDDTIRFFVLPPKSGNYQDLIINVEGSSPMPIYLQIGEMCCTSYDLFNYDLIPANSTYIVIAKYGFDFSGSEGFIPKNYWKKKALEFRAERVNKVIQFVQDSLFNPRKLIVVGTSQGSDVVAKLGTVNNDITHIVFLASGGLNQLIDFLTMTRKDVFRGKITEEESKVIIDSLLLQFQKFYQNPSPDKSWDDTSYLSYVSFSEPPIESLLKIDIPIFVGIGTADNNVPIESAYIIPIEFMRHQKSNLTFRHYPNYDHSFEEMLPDGSVIDHWDEVTKEFLKWIENTK